MKKFTLTITVLSLAGLGLALPNSALAVAPDPPVLITKPDPLVAAPTQTFTWNKATGEVYECRLVVSETVGEPFECGTTEGSYTTLGILDYGDHSFKLRRSNDNKATWSDWASASFKIGFAFTEKPDPSTASPQHTFRWNKYTGESYKCYIDGETETEVVACDNGGVPAGPTSYTTNAGLSKGTHSFRIKRSKNGGANWSTLTAAEFKVGQAVPVFTSEPFSGLALPTQTLTWTPSPGSTYQCKLDNAVVSCGAGTYTTPENLQSEKEQTFAIRQTKISSPGEEDWSEWAAITFKTGPITSDDQIAKLIGNLAKQMWESNYQARFRNRYAGMYVRKAILGTCPTMLTAGVNSTVDPQVSLQVRQAYLTDIWNAVLGPLLAHHKVFLDKLKAQVVPLLNSSGVSAEKKTLVNQTIQNEETVYNQLNGDRFDKLCSSLTAWNTAGWLASSTPADVTAWWSGHVDTYRTSQWMPQAQFNSLKSWLLGAGFQLSDMKSFLRHGWKWQAKSVIDDWSSVDSVLKTAMLDRQNMAQAYKPRFESHISTAPAQLQKYDLLVGSGTDVAAEGDTVQIKLAAAQYSDGKVFDEATWKLGTTLSFKIGPTNKAVVAGINQGVVGMKAGGRRQMFIPSSLAYGSTGLPGLVNPNEAVSAVVDVVKVTKAGSTPPPTPKPNPTVKVTVPPKGSTAMKMSVRSYAGTGLASYHLQTVRWPGWKFKKWDSNRTGYQLVRTLNSRCDVVVEVDTNDGRDYLEGSSDLAGYINRQFSLNRNVKNVASGYLNNVRRNIAGGTWDLLGRYRVVSLETVASSGTKLGYKAVAAFVASGKTNNQYYRVAHIEASVTPNMFNYKGCTTKMIAGFKNTAVVIARNARLVS